MTSKYNPNHHNRSSIRLRAFDYATPGDYFVTICTRERECLFGDIVNGGMKLSKIGGIARECWVELPKHFPNIELDEHEVMPNHVHGIVRINSRQKGFQLKRLRANNRGRDLINQIPTKVSSNWILTKDPNQTLGKIIRHYKARTTKFCHDAGFTDFAWQPRFHDHIIRSQGDLNRTRKYIKDNVKNWSKDEENPQTIADKNKSSQ